MSNRDYAAEKKAAEERRQREASQRRQEEERRRQTAERARREADQLRERLRQEEQQRQREADKRSRQEQQRRRDEQRQREAAQQREQERQRAIKAGTSKGASEGEAIMICQPCRSAGQYLNDIKRPDGDRIDLAQSEHNRCKGGTWCDCQHKTPYRRQLDGDGSSASDETPAGPIMEVIGAAFGDRQYDPPGEHWKNPYPGDRGQEFCGHCGGDWPCEGVQRDDPADA
jgi:hypothetical protein